MVSKGTNAKKMAADPTIKICGMGSVEKCRAEKLYVSYYASTQTFFRE